MTTTMANQHPGQAFTRTKFREFVLGSLFGGALATLVMLHVGYQLEPVPAVNPPEAVLMLNDAATVSEPRHDLQDSITPSTVLGPVIINR